MVVLFPDSGRSYLSKIYNDEWMRQNGYLQRYPVQATVLDVVKDRGGMEKSPSLRDAIVNECFRRGLLLLGCGSSAIRFIPSLTVSGRQLEIGMRIFRDAAQAVQRRESKLP